MEDEFLRLIRNNTKKIPKHMRDTESCRESLLFIYKAGAAAMREKCAEVADASKYPTNFIYAEEMDGYNAARMYIAAAIRNIGVRDEETNNNHKGCTVPAYAQPFKAITSRV